jgi:AcrR family transcriptional regulator
MRQGVEQITPPSIDKPKGRPRDSRAKRAVLDAALTLAGSGGMALLSIDGIAAHAGVSKPTIYRWWPTKAAILIEALLGVTTSAAPYPDTGTVEDDLRIHAIAYARLLTGPHGNAYRAVFGEAQRDPQTAALLYESLIRPRRALTGSVLERGIERGQLRAAIDIEAAIDLLYAPLIYRLLLGHAPLRIKDVATLVTLALTGLQAGPS